MKNGKFETQSLSVIIPVTGRFDDMSLLLPAYREMLGNLGYRYEIIMILDGPQREFRESIARVPTAMQPNLIIELGRRFGEAACLMQGARRASSELVLILPAYFQVEPSSIAALFEHQGDADVITAARDRSHDTPMNRARGWFFDRCATLAGSSYRDPGCAVRLLKTSVLHDLDLQDQQHRFLPLLAEQSHYVVKLVTLPQAVMDRRFRYHTPTDYLGTLLDLISLGFLIRFMQKPFRFFGSIGVVLSLVGVIIALHLLVERTFFGVGMADRPLILLATLLIVLGMQIAVVGLIAEIVIFTRRRNYSTYKIEKVLCTEQDSPPDEPEQKASPNFDVSAYTLQFAQTSPS